MSDPTEDGIEAARRMLDEAKEVPPRGPKLAVDNTVDNTGAEGGKAKTARARKPAPRPRGEGKTDRDRWYEETEPHIKWGDDGLPEGCGVVPLGVNETSGETFHYYLNRRRAMLALAPDKHSRHRLVSMFGSEEPLRRFWPAFTPAGTLRGFKPEATASALMEASGLKGIWSPLERVRGTGAWRDAQGGLVYHCGQAVLIGGAWKKPGLHGDYVYSSSPSAAMPAAHPVPGGEGGTGHAVLDVLRSWKWERPDIDPLLLLGWIGAGMLGGALDWRPFVWVTGDTSTGKSTLHRFIAALLGGASIKASDATAAGIWQRVRHSAWPVQIDELEPQADNRKVKAVVELARQASSGGVILRGDAAHQGVEFTARNCFMFSSILIPPLPNQDLTRLAILELGALDPATRLVIDEALWRAWGDDIRARMIAAWPRLHGLIDGAREVLMRPLARGGGGHNSRGGDQFGTLLACAHAILEEEPPSAHDLAEWARQLSAGKLQAAQDAVSNAEAMLIRLMGFVDQQQGLRVTVGELIEQACLDPKPGLDASSDENAETRERAEAALGRLGLKVLWERAASDDGAAPAWLVIANRHPGLSRIFAGSVWQDAPDASGVWRQAAKRLAGADTWPKDGAGGGPGSGEGRVAWFAGVVSKVIRVPLGHVRGGVL